MLFKHVAIVLLGLGSLFVPSVASAQAFPFGMIGETGAKVNGVEGLHQYKAGDTLTASVEAWLMLMSNLGGPADTETFYLDLQWYDSMGQKINGANATTSETLTTSAPDWMTFDEMDLSSSITAEANHDLYSLLAKLYYYDDTGAKVECDGATIGFTEEMMMPMP